MLALKLDHIDVACLPAQLHNRPKQIPEAMRAKIRANRAAYDEILCLYGDCGTGGELDRVLEEEGVTRIEGAHCYAFYAGEEAFSALAEEEPGTFYLTDFLARHFDALVIRGLGLDRFPELRDDYFGNYRRVVHLAQFDDPDLREGQAAAERLGLAYERRFTGLAGSARFSTARRKRRTRRGQPDHPLLARHSEPGHRQGRPLGGQARTLGAVHPRHRRSRDACRRKERRRLSRRVAARRARALRRRPGSGGGSRRRRLEAEYDTHRLAVLAKHDGRENPA